MKPGHVPASGESSSCVFDDSPSFEHSDALALQGPPGSSLPALPLYVPEGAVLGVERLPPPHDIDMAAIQVSANSNPTLIVGVSSFDTYDQSSSMPEGTCERFLCKRDTNRKEHGGRLLRRLITC